MNINGINTTTLEYNAQQHSVSIIDQTLLPHQFQRLELNSLASFCLAISSMQVRGAPLIGITAAFGLAFAAMRATDSIQNAYQALLATRPTAINLQWALDRIMSKITQYPDDAGRIALIEAQTMRLEDIDCCERIGNEGLAIIKGIAANMQRPINILTHCNAGWLATIDWGTALAPIYKAHNAGIAVHVWVDETRPRNQGAHLTAWELAQHGIAHTLICDNTGGHLMQQGLVDLCIVGSDRTSANGDVCNKIGTYLKALAAFDNQIPFYVALPVSTIDWSLHNGVKEIPIEQRDSSEVLWVEGLSNAGKLERVKIVDNSPAANYAFDVTPARLVTALITEHGIVKANQVALQTLKQTLHQA